MVTSPFTPDTLIALAALKGKLHDPEDGVRYWAVCYSTDAVKEYSGPIGNSPTVIEVDGLMPVWDRQRLVAEMNEAFRAAQVAA